MSIQRRNSDRKVQNVQAVQPLRSVQTPTSFLPRVAGKDEDGGVTLRLYAFAKDHPVSKSQLCALGTSAVNIRISCSPQRRRVR